MSLAPPAAPRAAAAPEAEALVGAMEREIAIALGEGAGNAALVQLLGAVRARAAAMAPAASPPPSPKELAAYGAAMGADLDKLEDLLEALQLFAISGS